MARSRRAAATAEPVAESFAANRRRLAMMTRVTKDMGDWRPAAEVLREIEAVPTRFLQYDVATGVGGHPISRITLLHGPSGHGKTKFALGLGESFLRREHFFGLLDAERTTPVSWVRQLMREIVTSPGFVALPASSYEKAVEGMRVFCTKIDAARGKLDQDLTALAVVDSIRSLQPAEMMKLAMNAAAVDGEKKKFGRRGGKKGIDGVGGRSGQIKAHLNSVWVDELVPLLADTRIAAVLVTREFDDEDAGFFDEGVKVGGGKGLYFGASLVVRVTSSFVYEGAEGAKRCVGECHHVAIRKTKLSGKLEPVTRANFYTSNGVDHPEGFWPERDALEIAEECGVVDLKGSWYSFAGKRLGNGRTGALKRLADEPALLAEIEGAVRETTRKRPA